MTPPHFLQRHLSFSFSTKARRPCSRMNWRFSIMLIEYFVLYRLSNCFSLLQGYLGHS